MVARPWKRIAARLEGLALLTRSGAVDGDGHVIVRMHRLVQEVVRLGLTAEQRSDRASTLEALVRERDAALAQTTRWTDARWELEPLTTLANVWADAGHPDAAVLLGQVGGGTRSPNGVVASP